MALQPLFIRGWKQLSAYVGGALLVKGSNLMILRYTRRNNT